MSGLFRNHRGIFYKLKREWGLTVYLYRSTDMTQNITTGVVAREFEVTKIVRAPVLPWVESRKFVYDLAYIAADKNFTEGAFFDKIDRAVIIRLKDIPYQPNLDDFIVLRNQAYEIKKVDVIEELQAVRLGITRIAGQDTFKWVNPVNIINFDSTAGAVI